MAELRNTKHERFAQLFAKTGNASQAYVKAGYSENRPDASAARLLANASVRARVEELKGKIADGVVNQEIGHRSARIAAYQDRWCKMKAVIAARAIDPALSEVAGGSTGLVVITDYKEQIDIDYSGGKPVKTVTLIPKYAVDTGLLREMRAIEQQAAQDMGQWAEAHRLVDKDGKDVLTLDMVDKIRGSE